MRRVIKLQQSILQIELDYSTARQGGNVEKGVLLKMGYLTAVVMAMHSSAWGTRALSFQNELPLLTALLCGSTARSQLLQPLLLSRFSQKKKNTTQQQHQTSKWQSAVRPSPFQKVASKAAPAPFCFLRLRRQATSLALSQLLGCRPGSSWQPRHTRPMGPAARPAPGTWPETLGQGAGGSAGCPSSAPTGWAWQTCCIC